MKFPRVLYAASLCLQVCLISLLAVPQALAGGENWKEWRPIDPAHIAMKSPVVEKDADAEALFWEVRVSYEDQGSTDVGTVLSHYIRIKIFTERGRESQSRIDIPFAKVFGRETKIKDIAGRTIKPDGQIIELKKEDVYERTIIKASGLKVKAKSFAMPGVEPGAIIEYRWREVRDGIPMYERFDFSRDIPIQNVRYNIKAYSNALVDSSGTPLGLRAQTFHGNMTPFQKEKDGSFTTTMTNVPAFHEEPRMPPQYAVRPWMLVFYAGDRQYKPQEFWAIYGKDLYEGHKSQMKVNDDIKRAAAEATGDAATPEEKLDRLFTYVRAKIKNVDDDAAGFTREQLEKIKANKTPADTLKRGVGNWHDIDMLFAALATAAGFEARVTKLTNRSDIFFDPGFTDRYFMDQGTENIAVRVGDGWRFYDPGTPYVAQGMLRWQEEGQDALVSDPKQPAFVKTPMSAPDKSKEIRRAKLTLDEEGTLEGDVTIEFTGHLAYDMKENNDEDSPAEREEALKARILSQLGGAELSNIRIENVTDPAKPFIYSFHIKVPGYAQRTGKRLFLKPAFFQSGVGPIFPTSERKNLVYFYYPWSEEDFVEINLPEGYGLDNATSPAQFGAAELSQYQPKAVITKDGRTLIYTRKFFFGGSNGERGSSLLFPTSSYPSLKAYFDELHKQDNHTISLKQGAAGLPTPTGGDGKSASSAKP